MDQDQDTIVALATPPGRGGIGVVRLSGPAALQIVAPLLRLRRPLAAGRARFAEILDTATGDVLDQAVATHFAAPLSYTGEDVVEIAGHGAPVLMEYLLRACCAQGARLARAGEFTERAFLSGRIDLTQAEAVGDLIEASTLEQARVAARQLGGAVSREIAPVKERLVSLLAAMEAGIDFAEDDIDLLQKAQIQLQITSVADPLHALARGFNYGRVVREGFRLALVGRPNAGKSSLFNRLLDRERAIVTASPGTTRDPIVERISIAGIPVELVDTAGLRGSSTSGAPLDEAETIGIERSREAMADAEVVVLVVDATLGLADDDRAILLALDGRGIVVALNKIDLAPATISETALAGVRLVETSALSGHGVEALRNAVLEVLQVAGIEHASVLVTHLRQQQSIENTLAALRAAQAAVQNNTPHEMILLDLYTALESLDQMTGTTSTEDILRLIFGRFCIGK